MTWIQEHREHLGMTRGEFAREITVKMGRGKMRVPEALIYILEVHPHPYTHPKLMQIIAHACGATKAQRDQFIAKQHRDLPYRETSPVLTVEKAHPWRRSPGATTEKAVKSAGQHARVRKCLQNCRAVVLINCRGDVVSRVESLDRAAEALGVGVDTAGERCRGKVVVEFSRTRHLTCRYADEWDAMTETERREMMARVVERSGNYIWAAREVVVIDEHGNERGRYGSTYIAADAEFVSQRTVVYHCRRKARKEFQGWIDVTFRYADEWDAMTEAERLKDVGAG